METIFLSLVKSHFIDNVGVSVFAVMAILVFFYRKYYAPWDSMIKEIHERTQKADNIEGTLQELKEKLLAIEIMTKDIEKATGAVTQIKLHNQLREIEATLHKLVKQSDSIHKVFNDFTKDNAINFNSLIGELQRTITLLNSIDSHNKADIEKVLSRINDVAEKLVRVATMLEPINKQTGGLK